MPVPVLQPRRMVETGVRNLRERTVPAGNQPPQRLHEQQCVESAGEFLPGVTTAMNIVEKALNLRAKWIRDHDDPPKFLIVGPGEWEQIRFAFAEAFLPVMPIPSPTGWDSGCTIAEMRVIVFERPMLLVSNNRTSGAPQSEATPEQCGLK